MKCRLFLLAHGRSGDKGDLVNIGVIARRDEWYEFLKRELSAERVARYLEPLGIGAVERFELSNLGALNFLVHDALGGGGALTLRLDAQGKTHAAALLRLPIELPRELGRKVLAHWGENLPADYLLTDDTGLAPGTGDG
jgi:hypothetical protein